MEYRHLGSSGLRISALSFGTWVTFGDQVEEDVAYECMKVARASGVNFFDNAERYSDGQAETIMGNIIKRAGWRRSEIVVSAKVFWGGPEQNDCGLSRKHIIEGTEASLLRLQMDYVDLLFCHRPDLHTPIEETVRAMSHLVTQGKAMYWGTSEWSGEQVRQAYEIARREHQIPPTMEQPQYNFFHRDRVEREYVRLYAEIGLGVTTWSPLASGLLTGKYNEGIPARSRLALEDYGWLRDQILNEEGKRRIEKVRRLTPIAEKLDCSLAQLALAWCLRNPNVSSVITGASRPEQVVENMGALDVVNRLTPDVIDNMETILGNKPSPEIDWRSAFD